jgi:hypothetical protein
VEELEELLAAVVPDQDGDGIGDPRDNCLLDANPDQRDSNLDGYGNLCDGDFDGDGVVAAPDLGALKQAYLKGQGQPEYAADIDLDGNGIVNALDLGWFGPIYLHAPGPSGLVCAGRTPPCQ